MSWQDHLNSLENKLFCKEMYLLGHGQKHSNEECRSLRETAELCFALAGFHKARLADQLRLLRAPEFPRLRRLVPVLFSAEAKRLEEQFAALEREHEGRLHPEPLLNGHDLLELGVPRGPRLKQLLHDLESEQLEGRLRSAREARRYLQGRLQG